MAGGAPRHLKTQIQVERPCAPAQVAKGYVFGDFVPWLE